MGHCGSNHLKESSLQNYLCRCKDTTFFVRQNKYLHIYEDNFEQRYLEMVAGALRIFYIDLYQSQFQFSTNTYVCKIAKIVFQFQIKTYNYYSIKFPTVFMTC